MLGSNDARPKLILICLNHVLNANLFPDQSCLCLDVVFFNLF